MTTPSLPFQTDVKVCLSVLLLFVAALLEACDVDPEDTHLLAMNGEEVGSTSTLAEVMEAAEALTSPAH